MDPFDLFSEQVADIKNDYPKLTAMQLDNGVPMLKGEIDIIDGNGKYWETYSVEIHCSHEFPYRFPKLYETGGMIPKIGDWHVYEDTKYCCIKVLPEEIMICNKGITLLRFIKEQVLPYLFNQTHRRVEGYYVNGEYSHGVKGVYEFYSRTLMENDVRKILDILLFICKGIKPGRTHECFCGSQEKFRRCHRDAFDALIGLGDKTLRDHVNLMAEYFHLV